MTRTVVERRIVLLGDSGVGKTVLVGYHEGDPESVRSSPPTIGVDYTVREVAVAPRRVALQIWDTAGQEHYNSILPSYVRNSSVCVLVFDITRRETFVNINKWSQMVRDVSPETVGILVGNKSDLAPARTVGSEEGKNLAAENHMEYCETSGLDGTGVAELWRVAATVEVPDAVLLDDARANVLRVPVPAGAESERSSQCGC